MSMRTKGLLFIGMLVAYGAFVAAYVLHENGALLKEFEEYRHTQKAEGALIEANLAVFDAYRALFLITERVERKIIVERVHDHVMVLTERYQTLSRLFPEEAEPYKRLIKYFSEAVVDPSVSKLRALKDALGRSKTDLDGLLAANRKLGEERFAAYHRRSNAAALSALLLGLLGLLVLGIGTSVFFGRMARDIRLLQVRVMQITQGYRGAPLEMRRSDELGSLLQGVNQMARDLAHRERELAMERQERFHREQTGSLAHFAAGLVHEIGNPVAAIGALNQALMDDAEMDGKERRESLLQVQGSVQRLVGITNDLTQLAAPLQTGDHIFDLNRLVRDVCSLLHYDERWYGVDIDLDLDPQVPAISGRSDQLNQVLMNLLTNAFDATHELGGTNPVIAISTLYTGDDEVVLIVEDNGSGMDEETQRRCFEPFYTTKDTSQGTGMGLFLGRSIVEAHGGKLSIRSQPGLGSDVRMVLPTARVEPS
ncbi:MAG: GHKL domain-containing protein [Deltaproteobacteria bacterium]|nr:GHKL domain-containing protein [Deltaproteobacteria bacterium]